MCSSLGEFWLRFIATSHGNILYKQYIANRRAYSDRLFSHITHVLIIMIYILIYALCFSKLCFCKFVFEWNTNRKLSIHVKILLLWNNLSYYIFHFIHTWPSVKRLEKKNKAFEIERACKFPKAFVIPYEWAIEINFVMYIASLYIFFMSP